MDFKTLCSRVKRSIMLIYKATNKVNDKSYIGQTTQKFSRRISSHKYNSITCNVTNYFYNAIRKYGFDNFEWSIVCECESKEELNEMEFHYIKQYNSHFSKKGYNTSWGGDGGLIGRKMSEETKIKMSLSSKGQVPWISGKHHTEETKKRISNATIGEKNGFYGKHHTKDTIINIKKKLSGCKSKLSKEYEITCPNGDKVIIKGLRQFCRDNNLTHQLMCSVSKNKQTHHKGYKCKEILWIL